MAYITNTAGAFGRLWRYRDLVRNLVLKDIKVRYMGAALGFAWSLANPIVITFMYLMIFTYIFPSTQPHFPLFLVTGIVHWTLFSQVIGQSCEVLVANSGLIKKIYFPRLLIPVASVLVNLVLWLAALGVYLVFYPLLGGKFSLVLFVYPLYLLLFVAFIWGLTLILSTLYVEFRDLKHLIEVALQVLFWATPIIYEVGRVPRHIQEVMILSPLAEFTIIFQQIFYANKLPSLNITMAFFAWTVVVVGLGLWLFNRRVPESVERL